MAKYLNVSIFFNAVEQLGFVGNVTFEVLPKSDSSLIAQFFFADEELNAITAELDGLDGQKEPERCAALVNKLRGCQDKVLGIVEKLMHQWIPRQRANCDFRVKFPDDVLTEGLAGQLWFGAECLAAGSSIINRSVESASLRPLAKTLTKHLEIMRGLLRDQCLRSQTSIPEQLRESLIEFDKLFTEFELGYVSAMVPVKTMKEYDRLQDVMVLFCEALERALKLAILNQDMVNDCDPSLMFAIPRLAIVCGLVIYPDGPLSPNKDPADLCEIFRPFQSLLYRIRNLLLTLKPVELVLLERALCSSDCDLENIQSELKQLETNAQNASRSERKRDGGYLKQKSLSSSTTMTALTHSVIEDSYDEDLAVKEDAFELPSGRRIPRDVSKDSGVAEHRHGEKRSASYVDRPSEVSIRCLRHSKSWPGRRTGEFFQSLTPLDSPDSELLTNFEESSSGGSPLSDNVRLRLSRDGRKNENTCRSLHNMANSDNRRSSGRSFVTFQQNEEGQEIGGYVSEALHEFCDTDIRILNLVPVNDAVSRDASNFNAIPPINELLSRTVLRERIQSNNTDKNDDDDLEILNDVVSVEDSILLNRRRLHSNYVRDSSRQYMPNNNSSRSGELDTLGSEPSNSSSPSTSSSSRHVDSREQRLNDRPLTDTEQMVNILSTIDDQEIFNEEEMDSESNESEEVTLAILGAEIAYRQEARARYPNTPELIHQLFVCISGVADQLQTNYASELRHILRAVFDGYAIDRNIEVAEEALSLHTTDSSHATERTSSSLDHGEETSSQRGKDSLAWVPDETVTSCLSCHAPFTIVRRRHHCRNCGQIFCNRCSMNTVPLPKYGHDKPVRVCNRCFVFQVTPFVLSE